MRLICPACGAAFDSDDDVANERAGCPHCGKWVAVSGLVTRQVIEPAAADELAALVGLPSRRTVVPISRHRNWPVVVVVLLVVGAVAGVSAYLSVSHPSAAREPIAEADIPAPVDKHKTEILKLKAAAAEAALDGDLRESYRRYQLVLAEAAANPSTDPVVVSAVATAQVEQAKIFAMLMEGKRGPATTEPVLPVALPGPAAVPAVVATADKPTTGPATLIASNSADVAPEIPGVPPGPRGVRTLGNDNGVTDAEIGEAIRKGILYLKSQYKNGVVSVGSGSMVTQLGGGGFRRGGGVGGGGFGGGQRGGGFGRRFGGGGPGANQPGGGPGGGGPGGGGGGARGGVSSIEGAATADGFDALAAYALLHAGQATDAKLIGPEDPFTKEMIETLKKLDLPYTYWRSLRASALSVLNRVQDKSALEADVAWLIAAHRNGGYTYLSYEDPRTVQSATGWDNSNAQYGLLGVWSGAEADISVPNTFWGQVMAHWSSCQMPSGQWGYHIEDERPTLSMTLAGVASELVCSDYLDTTGAVAGKGLATPADAGLKWLDTGDNIVEEPGLYHGYVLYGIERVGLASGFKYFGQHDWYAENARTLVASQHADGSWGSGDEMLTVMDTSYSLLFLARGRHPILYNRMRYDGAWNTHPRAIAHLAKYASKSLERPLNWQVVNFARPWFDWMDSPVLYLSGTDAPKLTEADYKKLADFANGGGLIFTHADNGSAAFNVFVDGLVRKIFPKYEFSNLPKDHPIYSTVYPIKQPPLLKVVTNGSRVLLVHSPIDIAEGWQSNWTDTQRTSFQMGINLFVYAAGKANFKNRLSSPYIPAYTAAVEKTIPVARLKYGGEWDPEPYAWTRFGRYFSAATKLAITETDVNMAEVTVGTAPIAVLTGTVRYDFLESESAGARAYVDGGGVLMIDACGGRSEFTKSVSILLNKAFPDAQPSILPETHPLFLASRPGADDLRKSVLRAYASQVDGKGLPLIGFAHGKGHVIFSRLDLTTGLLGTNQWGIMGYDPDYSAALMKNAVLWAAARRTR